MCRHASASKRSAYALDDVARRLRAATDASMRRRRATRT
ncbi:hypothetical protein AKJ09_04549 [Labilithrix luteola]|uniref:Uncharacterized protein n=1 Tax=Labilithrix luteola TaxID=1391654 RepID=A0A0K1PWH8_9BACT|nr:hypothetical protein AKJ09_04549 [Labilithrix luteola]